MRLKCYIEDYGARAFDIVSGSVINEQANETLDSATINLTNVNELLNLRPYQKVKIFDIDGTYQRTFLIDNFVSTEINVTDKIYEYTINLFSETKLLEKIQIPNCIHRESSLNVDTFTIADNIEKYMELYCPKIKKTLDGRTRDYGYIFEWGDFIQQHIERLSVDCPEFQMSEPTLRDVLNFLFLYVGMLPKITDGKLDCIDLRKAPTKAPNNNYIITRSNSSDSYVNTLTSYVSQALNNNNYIRNEIIGFRDRDNVFLKHTENLKLTTSFGIESVQKLILNAYVVASISLKREVLPQGLTYHPTNLENPTDDILLKSTLSRTLRNVVVNYYQATITQISEEPYPGQTTQHISMGLASKPKLVKSVELGNVVLTANNVVNLSVDKPTGQFNFTILEFRYENINYSLNSFIECYQARTKVVGDSTMYYYASLHNVPFLYQFDISDIVLEESKRNLLNTDYRNIDLLSYNEFKNNYYTTLSFQYGHNEIKGFSNKWSEFQWYGSTDNNFMDTLWRTIIEEKIETFVDTIKNDISTEYLIPLNQISHINNGSIIKGLKPRAIGQNDKNLLVKILQNLGIQESDPYFSPYALMFFSISYRPFNEIALTYPKEEIEVPFAITQLDKQESSIPMLDTFSEREFEKVNRLGNNLLNISQPQLKSIEDVLPLNCEIQNSIIFSREIRIYEDFVEAHLVASEDYILKNYFTSLHTNYRAFEFVDFTDSIVRKENKTIYVHILNEQLDNLDDHIKIVNKTNDVVFDSLYISALRHNEKTFATDNSLKYALLGDGNAYYKTDLSALTFKNSMAFNYVEYDNNSHGIYIKNPSDYKKNELLGGYTQGRYISSQDYRSLHFVGFSNKNILKSQTNILEDFTEMAKLVADSLKAPKIETLPNNVLALVSDKTRQRDYYNFYKDLGEVINQTLQFVYVPPKELRLFNNFFDMNMLVYNAKYPFAKFVDYVVVFSDYEGEIKNKLATDEEELFGRRGYATKNHFNRLYSKSSENYNKKYAHICIKMLVNERYNGYIDLIRIDLNLGFEKYGQGSHLYYFVPNDTKTLKVYEQNPTSKIFEQKREVAKSSNRTLKVI